MIVRRIAVSVASSVVVLAAVAAAHAHPLRFGVLEIVERADSEVTARLRFSGSERAPQSAEIVLPEGCADVAPAVVMPIPYGIERERRVSCAPGALAAGPVGVRGIGEPDQRTPRPQVDPAQVMLRVRHADGGAVEVMLDAGTPVWRGGTGRAATSSPSAVIARYGALGVEHILLGFDHLLFLAVLLLMIRERRRLVIAITAFTAGHSATLLLAALDVVRLPSAPVEAAIAISIAVVAAEVLRRGAREPSLRDAALLPPAFGLIHGLGFAGVLREVGLPDAELVPALLSFNVGVEIGQLLFVAAAVGLLALLRRLPPAIGSRGPVTLAYGAGIAAAVLCIDRVLEIGAFS
jgi:hypothetical protein